MELNTDFAQELLSRPTYKRMLDPHRQAVDEKLLIERFIDRVRQEFPAFYEDWDETSFVVNDILQPVFRKVLKEEVVANSTYGEELAKVFFQKKVIETSLTEYLRKKREHRNYELVIMFSWYCFYEHNEWFSSFLPEEMHMGDYHWKDDIEKIYHQFLAKFNL